MASDPKPEFADLKGRVTVESFEQSMAVQAAFNTEADRASPEIPIPQDKVSKKQMMTLDEELQSVKKDIKALKRDIRRAYRELNKINKDITDGAFTGTALVELKYSKNNKCRQIEELEMWLEDQVEYYYSIKE